MVLSSHFPKKQERAVVAGLVLKIRVFHGSRRSERILNTTSEYFTVLIGKVYEPNCVSYS